MKVVKDGILRSIDVKDLGYYTERGWRKSSSSEPQPSQENLYIVDDYTIAKINDV